MLGQKDQVTTLGGTRTPEQRRDGERARALDVELVLLEPQLVQRRQVHLKNIMAMVANPRCCNNI